MVTAQQVHKPPGKGWTPENAKNLADTWFLVEQHRPAGFPMSPAMFVTIFFEETACCNMLQQETPAAIGPGQLQVSEIGKVDFFAAKNNFMGGQWDSSMTILAVNQATVKVFTRSKRLHPELKELTKSDILADHEFSIKMHVKFMQWLSMGFGADGKTKELDGLLSAQTGGNQQANAAFKAGARELDKMMQPDSTIDYGWSDAQWKAFYAKRRLGFMNALNTARRGIHGNPVPANCEQFWEFFLPDEFLQNPLGYVKWGF